MPEYPLTDEELNLADLRGENESLQKKAGAFDTIRALLAAEEWPESEESLVSRIALIVDGISK